MLALGSLFGLVFYFAWQ
uniref:Uncharacterized protein n=1 Tax=Arundo donax TaxID=35708 RepID=A0A0A8ZI83_ARUDO